MTGESWEEQGFGPDATTDSVEAVYAEIQRRASSGGTVHPFYSFEPMPYQEQFLRSQKKVASLCGANQIGKSSAGAYWIAGRLMGFYPPVPDVEVPVPGYYWACTKGDLLDGLIEKVLGFVPPEDIARLRVSMRPFIEMKNGSWVRFKSYDQPRAAFQQAALHGILNDEEMPRDIWQEQMTRLIRYDGKMRLTFSPIEGTVWIHQLLFSDKNRGWVDVFGASMMENKHLPKSAVDAYIAQFQDDPQQFQIRVQGIYALAAGDSVFHAEALSGLRAYVRPPEHRWVVVGRDIQDDDSGHPWSWKIWIPPKPGHRYSLGTDIADGSMAGTWTTAAIYDADTSEIVATCRKRVDPYEWAAELTVLASRYNRALICPETNAYGVACVSHLIELHYPFLYRRVRMGGGGMTGGSTSKEPSRRAIGWQTTAATKPLLVGSFQALVNRGGLVLYDEYLLEEMENFVRLRKDQPGMHGFGPKVGFDDLVMASMLAYEGATQIPRHHQVLGARYQKRDLASLCEEQARQYAQSRLGEGDDDLMAGGSGDDPDEVWL